MILVKPNTGLYWPLRLCYRSFPWHKRYIKRLWLGILRLKWKIFGRKITIKLKNPSYGISIDDIVSCNSYTDTEQARRMRTASFISNNDFRTNRTG